MDPLLFKVIAILLIFSGGVAGGLVPLRIGVSERGKRLLSYGNAFAGGIFLGAGLIHMLSDANEKFQSFAGDVDYPIGALVCGCGFFLVLFLEKVLIRGHDVDEMSDDRPIYPFVLLLVLSVHSIIAGVALGLETTLVASAVIFIAIIAHKSTAAFALSASLKNAGAGSGKIRKTVIFFSTMTPLGILAGGVFSALATSVTATMIEAVFDALAAGTFLYVAVLDIIDEVFDGGRGRWMKFMLMCLSFGFMALIALWT